MTPQVLILNDIQVFLLLCLAILEHLARISPNGMKDVYEILKQQRQTVVEGQYPNFLYDWAELCLQYLDSLGKLEMLVLFVYVAVSMATVDWNCPGLVVIGGDSRVRWPEFESQQPHSRL